MKQEIEKQENKEHNQACVDFSNKINGQSKFINLKLSNQQPYLIPKAQTSNLYYKQSFEKQQNAITNNTFSYLGTFSNTQQPLSEKQPQLENCLANSFLSQKNQTFSAKYKKSTEKTFEEFISNKTILNCQFPKNLLQNQSLINNSKGFELEKSVQSQKKKSCFLQNFKKREISGNISEHSRMSSKKKESASFVVAMKALQGKIKRMEGEMNIQMSSEQQQKMKISELEQTVQELQTEKINLQVSNQQSQKINEELLASFKLQQQQIQEVNGYQMENLKAIQSLEKTNRELMKMKKDKAKTQEIKEKFYEEYTELFRKVNELNESKLKVEIQYVESIGKLTQYQEQNGKEIQALNQIIADLTQNNKQLTNQKKIEDEKIISFKKHMSSLTENQEKQINSLNHTNQILQAKNNELEQKLQIYETKVNDQLFELQKLSKIKEFKSRCNRNSIEFSDKMIQNCQKFELNRDSYQLETERTNVGDTSTQSDRKDHLHNKENLNLNHYKRKLTFENEKILTPRKNLNEKVGNQSQSDGQFQVLLNCLQYCNSKQKKQLKEQFSNLVNKQQNSKNALQPTSRSNQLPNNCFQQL